jgi:hypothetical protein
VEASEMENKQGVSKQGRYILAAKQQPHDTIKTPKEDKAIDFYVSACPPTFLQRRIIGLEKIQETKYQNIQNLEILILSYRIQNTTSLKV